MRGGKDRMVGGEGHEREAGRRPRDTTGEKFKC